MLSAWRNWRRERAARRIEITEDQWREAEYALPFLDRLSGEQRQRLRELARAFIAEKQWSAAAGLTLTPAIQISIALQACLPILDLGLDWYHGWVGIVVYPGDFVIPRQIVDEDGVVHEYDDAVLGEAWEGGPVLLSWFDDPAEPGDVSIVIHEFAHKLDMTNGAVDGMPRLHAGMSAADWRAAFQPAYEDFCRRVDAGEETQIDPYAAEHPSEFFAVVSEVFFEAPELLMAQYPAVYAQLRLFYRQDPLDDGHRLVAMQQT
ncbi:MAG: zinc-dependent peptidase [Rhodocyclaceae bacterium]|jgi:Mlc titration factor MtfA (ptsG expression regulator)|nr:zinc-dependent peptidase [Rhodocyclaceae bacterium]